MIVWLGRIFGGCFCGVQLVGCMALGLGLGDCKGCLSAVLVLHLMIGTVFFGEEMCFDICRGLAATADMGLGLVLLLKFELIFAFDT